MATGGPGFLAAFVGEQSAVYKQLYSSLPREDNRIFLVECPGGKRTREVLMKIIHDHVLPGTHILTDGWAAYRTLGDEGKMGSCGGGGFHHGSTEHDKCFPQTLPSHGPWSTTTSAMWIL